MSESKHICQLVVCPATDENPRHNNGTLISLDDGSLLLVYQNWYTSSGKQDASPARVAGRLSSDGGRSWSSAFIIKESYAPGIYEGGGRRIGSPSLLKMASGQLLLFHDVMNSVDDHRIFLSRSNDSGLTWSESIPIISKLGYYVANNDRAIQLSNGRILVPVADHGMPFRRHGISFGLYSDDEGRTWQRGTSTVDVSGEAGAQEPGLVELADGRVLMYVRTSLGHIYKSYSADRGETWSQPESMEIASPTSPQTIRRVPSTGDMLMVWNHAPGPARTPLALAVSSDEGLTWERFWNIDSEEGHTYAYPSIFFHDDEVLITYYDSVEGAEVDRSSRLVSLKLAIVSVDAIYA